MAHEAAFLGEVEDIGLVDERGDDEAGQAAPPAPPGAVVEKAGAALGPQDRRLLHTSPIGVVAVFLDTGQQPRKPAMAFRLDRGGEALGVSACEACLKLG